jgi:hypothetical protein
MKWYSAKQVGVIYINLREVRSGAPQKLTLCPSNVGS